MSEVPYEALLENELLVYKNENLGQEISSNELPPTVTGINPESTFDAYEMIFEEIEAAEQDALDEVRDTIETIEDIDKQAPRAELFASETYDIIAEHFDLETGPATTFSYELHDGEYSPIDEQTGEWIPLRSLVDNFDEWLVDRSRGVSDVNVFYVEETDATVTTITAMVNQDIVSTMVEIPGYVSKEEIFEILTPEPQSEPEKTQEPPQPPELDISLAEKAALDVYDLIAEQFDPTTGPSTPYGINKNEKGEYGAIDETTGQWRSSRSLYDNGTEKIWDYDEWVSHLESGGTDVTTQYDEQADRTWVTVNQLVGESIVSTMVELAGYVNAEEIQELLENEVDLNESPTEPDQIIEDQNEPLDDDEPLSLGEAIIVDDLTEISFEIDSSLDSEQEIILEHPEETDFDYRDKQEPIITIVDQTIEKDGQLEQSIIVNRTVEIDDTTHTNPAEAQTTQNIEVKELIVIRAIIESIEEAPLPEEFKTFTQTPVYISPIETDLILQPETTATNFLEQKAFRADILDFPIDPVRQLITHIDDESMVSVIIQETKQKIIAPKIGNLVPTPPPPQPSPAPEPLLPQPLELQLPKEQEKIIKQPQTPIAKPKIVNLIKPINSVNLVVDEQKLENKTNVVSQQQTSTTREQKKQSTQDKQVVQGTQTTRLETPTTIKRQEQKEVVAENTTTATDRQSTRAITRQVKNASAKQENDQGVKKIEKIITKKDQKPEEAKQKIQSNIQVATTRQSVEKAQTKNQGQERFGIETTKNITIAKPEIKRAPAIATTRLSAPKYVARALRFKTKNNQQAQAINWLAAYAELPLAA